MAVTNTTLRTETWNLIYTSLNTGVTDPESRSDQWIFSAFPSQNDTFIGYPILVISPVEVSDEELQFGSGKFPKKVVDCEITIYTKKASQIDSLSDEIEETIRSDVATFQADGLNKPMIRDGSTDTFQVGDTRVHLKPMSLRFMRWS